MSKLGEIGQDFSRLSEIAQVMRRYGFAPGFKQSPHEQKSTSERFAAMLQDLGPTFVKIGQLLSTRGDLLPANFIEALSLLQDRVPPFEFADAKQQIESALGKSLPELFASFEATPLASASIAQVYAAKLHDGSDVVVKVRRPGIEWQIARDSSLLLSVAQLLEWLVDGVADYQAVELAEEFKHALQNELDFHHEAQNLDAFRANNTQRPIVYVPKVFPELSSDRVLTMERIFGRRISDLKNHSNAHHIVEELIGLAFEHVFIDGLFHADPHPGNILITDDNRIAFVDFGLLGQVARDHQDRLLFILLSISLKDPDTLCRQLIQVGEPKGRVEIHRFRNSVRRLLDKYVGLSISQIRAGSIMSDLLNVSLQYKIHLPKEFALLTRASLSLEGIVRLLHPSLNVSGKLSKKAEELLEQRLDPRNFRSTGMKTALQLVTLAQDLPAQINQTLADLERGEIQVTVRSSELEKLNHTLRCATIVICNALLSATLIFGGLDWLDRSRWVAFSCFGLAAMLSSTSLIWLLTKGHMPKMSLYWLAKKQKFLK